jgi:transmembrane sensor
MGRKQKRRFNSGADNTLKEAGEWFLDIQTDSLSSDGMDDFSEWVDEKDTNQEKLDLIASTWNAMDVLKDNPMVVRTLDKSRAKERDATKDYWFFRIIPNLSGFRYAAVTAALLLVMGGIWLFQNNSLPSEIYETNIGVQKTIYLSDGSTVYIDTDSALSASITEEFRYIVLSRGRAFFSVAPDPKRPFIVRADNVTARAVGTEFEVYKKKGGSLTIAVSKGLVQVNQVKEKYRSNRRQSAKNRPFVSTVQTASEQELLSMKPDSSIFSGKVLEPGQGVVVDGKKPEYVVTSYDLDNDGIWRQGRLKFSNKALSEVVEELNRYLTKNIIIGDDGLNDIKINAYFKIKNREEFVATLESVYPIAHRSFSDGTVVLFFDNAS